LRHKAFITALLCLVPLRGADVPFSRLAKASEDARNWLTYWGDYHATRFRDLKQINAGNVKNLRLEWMFQTDAPGAFETVPLVVDGVMYFTAPDSSVYAIDARFGRKLWRYQYHVPKDAKPCCGTINRGLAILGDRLFMLTPDARLLALDVRNGEVIWNVEVAPSHGGSFGGTEAPLVVKDKVVVGVAAGDYGIRGFLDAYDAATGKRAWRFWTIPGPGEPGHETWGGDSWEHGGGATWMTGTYDPELNTVYWGVGNPSPDMVGSVRPGDNLFSDSVIALDADTGKLKWHYQFTPHDMFDWDATEVPMLLDLPWKGEKRKVVVQANRNAFFYVLDRVTGEFLMAEPFAKQTWTTGMDSKGRPAMIPNLDPTPAGTVVCPQCAGATNWMAPSYSPITGLFYLNVREGCDRYFSQTPIYKEGTSYWATFFRGEPVEGGQGRVSALDPLTGKTKWSFPLHAAPWAGTLATSGGLVFAGDEDGYLMALQAETGKLLWKVNTGSRLVTSPITFELDGKQYVTMPSGAAVLTFALPEE
jgi:alcohol dehydrogenase (cytochrome c)